MQEARPKPSRAWAVIACALLGTGLSGPVAAAAKIRICLVSVTDDTGQGSQKKLRKQLEASTTDQPDLDVVPYVAYAKAAHKAGIPQDRWTEVTVLGQLAPELRFDAALMAWLSRHGKEYRLLLVGVDPSTGKRVGKATMRLPRPTLSAERSKELIAQLARELVQNVEPAEEPPPPPPPDQPPTDQPPTDPNQPEGDQPPPDPGTVGGTTGEETPTEGGDDEWGDFDEEAFEEIVEDELVSTLKVEMGGRVRVEHFSYFKDLGPDRVNGRNSLDLGLKGKASIKSVVTEGRFLVRYDHSDPSRNRIDAEEAYIQFGLGPLTIRAGRTLVSWGTASLINPSDLINPYDYRDPLEEEKLGAWMLRSKLVLGPMLLDGYVMPVAEPNLIPFYDSVNRAGLPSSTSRWILDDDEDFPDEQGVRYRFTDLKPRPGPPENYQGALRLAASVLETDISVGYAYLWDRMPTLRSIVTPAPPNADVELRLEYQRIHAITADIERAFGGLRAAFEGVLVITEDFEGVVDEEENPFTTLVLGLDYRTPDFFTNHNLHFFVDVLYTHMLVEGQVEGALADLRHPLMLGLLSRVSYEWGQDFKFDFNLVTALDRFDILIYPEIEYIVMDNVSVQGAWQLLIGDDDEGFFGPYRDNSRVMLNIEVRF